MYFVVVMSLAEGGKDYLLFGVTASAVMPSEAPREMNCWSFVSVL